MLETLQTIIKQTVNISIFDIIDIAIVAFVIYKAIKMIKETRAEQLIKGIVILLVVLQLSDWLQLDAINYILRNTMQLGLLALLIVFQPELRKGLEHVGRSNIGSFFKVENKEEILKRKDVISNICYACGNLSRNKIGALIVIERETKLGDIIHTGTAIEAIVSSQLLENIFFPNSPLHDGAAVIRNNKIAAANAYLPLTEDNTLSRELGTRHRAAIGISEISDCIVVVVSEETGKISIARNGSMTRNLTVDTLSRALNRLMIPPEEDGEASSIIKKVKHRWKNNS